MSTEQMSGEYPNKSGGSRRRSRRGMWRRGLPPVFAHLLILAGTLRAASTAPDYSRDIEPILSDNCYQCHGPDSAKRKADLRLDQKDSAFASHDGHTALVAGDVRKSELVTRV